MLMLMSTSLSSVDRFVITLTVCTLALAKDSSTTNERTFPTLCTSQVV
jgi:hypothetical protein